MRGATSNDRPFFAFANVVVSSLSFFSSDPRANLIAIQGMSDCRTCVRDELSLWFMRNQEPPWVIARPLNEVIVLADDLESLLPKLVLHCF